MSRSRSSSSETRLGRPSASSSERMSSGTPSALAEGRPSLPGTNVSQIAASVRRRLSLTWQHPAMLPRRVYAAIGDVATSAPFSRLHALAYRVFGGRGVDHALGCEIL